MAWHWKPRSREDKRGLISWTAAFLLYQSILDKEDKESGVTDQGWPVCVFLPSDRDVKLIILIIATTIITINIYILNKIIITSIIIIRWRGDLRVWFRVRRRVKRWVQMSCMPCSYEEPCSDQEMRPSLLPWMLVKNLQVLLPFLRRFSVILIGMKYYLNIYYSIPSAIVLSLH